MTAEKEVFVNSVSAPESCNNKQYHCTTVILRRTGARLAQLLQSLTPTKSFAGTQMWEETSNTRTDFRLERMIKVTLEVKLKGSISINPYYISLLT